ncbi:MAG: hypothetical protein IRZ32_14450, partial [Solirubrobacteraceae bacterium]|nr:hypothetical protein [Solirubrobacteraceae bacterium]
MSAQELHALLEEVPDTFELVVVSPDAGPVGLLAAWRCAHDEATRALAAWRRAPGREAFAAFRAAQDQRL